MSAEVVKQIIQRATAEPEFRQRLLNEQDAVLAEFDLTDDEKMSLKAMPVEAYDAFALKLDDHLKRGTLPRKPGAGL